MIYRQNFTFYQKKTGFRHFAKALLLALLVTNSIATAQAELKLSPAHDVIFPSDRLDTSDGEGFSIADQNRAMIVNFWATWCAPCVTELPELAEAAHLLSDDVDVVLISVDRKGAQHAQTFLDERNITGVISAYNPKSDWPRSLKLRGLPSTYLISADQTDIYLVSGPASWADEAILSKIKSLILTP